MEAIIKTTRLLLRKLTPDDAHIFYSLNLDPEVIQYTGDPPFSSVKDARIFLLKYDQYRKYGYGRWAVVHRETGEWLGWCGLKFEEEYGDTDIGYRFFKKHWGNGYATESARACLAYGFEKLGLTRIVGRAMKANPASIRVFEKVGMSFVEDIKMEGVDSVLYEINNKKNDVP